MRRKMLHENRIKYTLLFLIHYVQKLCSSALETTLLLFCVLVKTHFSLQLQVLTTLTAPWL